MRYFVFAGEEYYAKGGGNDLHSSTNSKETAIIFADAALTQDYNYGKYEWAHVFDTETLKVVYRTGGTPHGQVPEGGY